MLYSFVPAVPSGGPAYLLPPVKQQHKPKLNFSMTGASTMQPQMMSGSQMPSGLGSGFIDYAEISGTFSTVPAWLISQGYHANFGGMESAIIDFYRFVVYGGLGILEDQMPSGTLDGISSVSSKRTSARIHGSPEVTRMLGAPVAEITFTFRCPTGFWTLSDGTLLPIH